MEGKHYLTKDEQETSILGNAGSAVWDIESADPRFINLMKRRGYVAVSEVKEWGSKRYKIPYAAITIRSARVRKRKAGGKD